MHARLDHAEVRLLTRNGLNWTGKYPPIAAAVSSIRARQAYLDGELCGIRPDGVTSFSMIQMASDAGLVFFLFDLLHLDGKDLAPAPVLGAIPKARARFSAPCCSPTTIPTDG